MTSQTSRTRSKLNLLLQNWPAGTVATQAWLTEIGFSSKLANWHIGSGWLERLGRGAFIRPGNEVTWQGGLYALQSQLSLTVHAGGRTALELIGRAHFVPLGKRKTVFLISDTAEQLPKWFRSYDWLADIRHSSISLYDSIPEKASISLGVGTFPIVLSSAERAVMEVIHMMRTNHGIEHVHNLMEGLTTLRPSLVQQLLEQCRSIKVKRFFLWSAETAGHDWFKRLDVDRVDLGKGKRQLYTGGVMNGKYLITVPAQEGLPHV